jgi:hypothetical protein
MTCRISLAAAGIALLSLAAVSGGAAEAQTHASSYAHQHGAQRTKIRAAVIKVIGTQGDVPRLPSPAPFSPSRASTAQ